ncbi:MAG: type I restriction endonuclease subunit R [Alphaproteobacteria bacterium]|nr:type I restriction endonuclease subunit R [Alphaproteobacteria bacterium]
MTNINDPYYLPNFDEASCSQIPAIIQLINLGYNYIGRHEVDQYRESKSQYILRDIAFKAIRSINGSNISDKSIKDAIISLEKVKMDDGVVNVSKNIYANLLGGVSVSEIIDGKKSSPQLKFIDWKNWDKNTFHVVPEFEISEEQNRRPDIVLFVNGIPFAVIENKKSSVPVDEAVTQMIRNQKGDQTPKFFLYPQILIATNVSEIKYGTMLTPKDFYSVWKEKDFEDKVLKSVNNPISKEDLDKISNDLLRSNYVQAPKENITPQDKGIYSLLEPERFLDLVRNFIVYDNGIKKVTRYQQYFAIKKILKKIENREENGKRKGGLVWHTQGSGKSLTMVMLVKNLIETISNPRVIVVTDRTDLDDQIMGTFKACNIKVGVKQANSKDDLIKKIKSKTTDVITTLVHKFDTKTTFKDDDNNIFILIDEAHRTQGGDANDSMNRILPRACQIAFTGTPLMTKEKSITESKFGGLIDSYTISEAEEDGAILPLIYQGRFVDQDVNNTIDLFYDNITTNFTEDQKKDFEKKFVSQSLLDETSQRIEMIAFDVSKHYKENFQGTGLKGQLVAPSKYTAILFKKALDMLGDIKTEVVISETQKTDAEEDKIETHKKVVEDFMKEEKRRYGSIEAREEKIIADYKKNPEGCEILIVVDKLLTGFDAPCDTVLYLAKQLKDHNLLQAIARVNRVYNGDKDKQSKVAGLIVDYSKNAKNLKNALTLFSNYNPEDIEGALLNTDDQIQLLDNIYQKIHEQFKDIKDVNNTDAYVQALMKDEDKRNKFYTNVNQFIRMFATCYSLYDFQQKFDDEKLNRYKMDLKKFVEIKKTTQLAAAEKVDFSKYKDQLHKLLDKYVTASEVEILSKEISLSDMREFNQYIEDEKQGLSDRSKAAAIAAQTKKTISERYKRDEIFYGKFSERLTVLLKELENAKREDVSSLFNEIKDIQNQVENYDDGDIPNELKDRKTSHPFYRNIKDLLEKKVDIEDIPDVINRIVDILVSLKKVDWYNDISIKRKFIMTTEDFLLDDIESELTIPDVELIANKCWDIAVLNEEIF